MTERTARYAGRPPWCPSLLFLHVMLSKRKSINYQLDDDDEAGDSAYPLGHARHPAR